MWTWIAIGVGVFFVLGTAVALGVAGTLGLIARDVSALYDADDWAEMPLSREAERHVGDPPAHRAELSRPRQRNRR